MSMTLPAVFEKHGIFDADIPTSGKGAVIKLQSGAEIHADLHIKETVMSDGRRWVFEANIAEALDEFMSNKSYEISVHQVQYEQQLSAYNREVAAAGERLEIMKEMGIVKTEVEHLPRLNKKLVKLYMSDGSIKPFYTVYNPLFNDDEYISQAVMNMKEHPEEWTLPSDGKQLTANASIINKPVPSKVIKF